MRNIFDQYKQPENRLTHALACYLNNDRKLIKSFLTDVLGLAHPSMNQLNLALQSLPERFEGNPPTSKPKRELGSGLSDMIIYDDMGWRVFIESKVTSNICKNQIDRHFATLQKRGYTLPQGVIISINDDVNSLPGCLMLTWSSVYKWLCGFCNKSFWAKETKNYFETLENIMVKEKKLNAGTITEFMGIPFNKNHALTYEEGKRVLKLTKKCQALDLGILCEFHDLTVD